MMCTILVFVIMLVGDSSSKMRQILENNIHFRKFRYIASLHTKVSDALGALVIAKKPETTFNKRKQMRNCSSIFRRLFLDSSLGFKRVEKFLFEIPSSSAPYLASMK